MLKENEKANIDSRSCFRVKAVSDVLENVIALISGTDQFAALICIRSIDDTENCLFGRLHI